MKQTTGSLPCVRDLFKCVYTPGTLAYSLNRRTFAESAQNWTPAKFWCSRKAKHVSETMPAVIVQELCESRGGRPGLSVLTSLSGFRGRKAILNHASALVSACP